VSQSQNAGQTWQAATDLNIPNPNSALAGLTLRNGAHILALNNIEAGRHRLVLMMSNSQSGQWHVIETLENDESAPDQERKEFSYPYLMSANSKDVHLVYTWDRKRIRHIYFPDNWLARAYSQLPITSVSEAGADMKGAQ
jgi:predicted neuraminidase